MNSALLHYIQTPLSTKWIKSMKQVRPLLQYELNTSYPAQIQRFVHRMNSRMTPEDVLLYSEEQIGLM
jgi:hypothetical protein